MAHYSGDNPTGYIRRPEPQPRPIDGERLHKIRVDLDPGTPYAERGRGAPRGGRSIPQWIDATEGETVIDYCRALLEHVDALQAELDRVDKGLAEALEIEE